MSQRPHRTSQHEPSKAADAVARMKGQEKQKRPKRWVERIWDKPYDELHPIAERIKALLQMAGGAILVILLFLKLGCRFFTTSCLTDWYFLDSDPLALIGEGLLYSTGIDLAYLLFTHGPDEAIDPLVTGLAAVILLRVPANNDTISLERAAEVAVYGLLLAVLFITRERFHKSERAKREAIEQRKQIDENRPLPGDLSEHTPGEA